MCSVPAKETGSVLLSKDLRCHSVTVMSAIKVIQKSGLNKVSMREEEEEEGEGVVVGGGGDFIEHMAKREGLHGATVSTAT